MEWHSIDTWTVYVVPQLSRDWEITAVRINGVDVSEGQAVQVPPGENVWFAVKVKNKSNVSGTCRIYRKVVTEDGEVILEKTGGGVEFGPNEERWIPAPDFGLDEFTMPEKSVTITIRLEAYY